MLRQEEKEEELDNLKKTWLRKRRCFLAGNNLARILIPNL